jgi:hypothetical protein
MIELLYPVIDCGRSGKQEQGSEVSYQTQMWKVREAEAGFRGFFLKCESAIQISQSGVPFLGSNNNQKENPLQSTIVGSSHTASGSLHNVTLKNYEAAAAKAHHALAVDHHEQKLYRSLQAQLGSLPAP